MAFEAAMCGSERDGPFSTGRYAIWSYNYFGMVVELLDTIAQKGTNYIRAADVEIAEVGAVGFVDVVVALGDRRAGSANRGLEK